MPRAKSRVDWLKEWISALVELGERFPKSGYTLQYGSHTLLKLICVKYYAGMFTRIAKGRSARAYNYDGAVYLDLFSGPGIVKIEGTGDRVAGSPIAATSVQPKFDYSIFVEIKSTAAKALEKRMASHLSSNQYTIIHGNCNEEIENIVGYINSRYKKPIILTFVDPEGMEAKWQTVKTLSREFRSIDFMINMTTGVSRVGGRLQSGMASDKSIFEDFFGERAENTLLRISSGEKEEEIYERGVREVLGRPVGATIPIRRRGGIVVYHVLGYTRLSLSLSPWARGFRELERRIGSTDGAFARQVLDVVKGRQRTFEFQS